MGRARAPEDPLRHGDALLLKGVAEYREIGDVTPRRPHALASICGVAMRAIGLRIGAIQPLKRFRDFGASVRRGGDLIRHRKMVRSAPNKDWAQPLDTCGWNAAAPQALVLRRNLAVQFHPEVDAESLAGWLADDGARDARDQGLDPDVLLEHVRSLDADVRVPAAELVDYSSTRWRGRRNELRA
jgi:hypothetical protein